MVLLLFKMPSGVFLLLCLQSVAADKTERSHIIYVRLCVLNFTSRDHTDHLRAFGAAHAPFKKLCELQHRAANGSTLTAQSLDMFPTLVSGNFFK